VLSLEALELGCLKSEDRKRNVDGGVLAGRLPEEKQFSKGKRSDETSAVDVLGQHPCRKAAGVGAVRIACTSERAQQEWDLVKRCDQPGKSSLQT
jgi:hypothetical protein